MRIFLHIGLEQVGADRLQQVLADQRDLLAGKGILFPASPGGKNHTRLFMAVTDPAHIDPLRFNRGYITPETQAVLHKAVAEDLTREIAEQSPDVLILTASQLGVSLYRPSELARLKALLAPLSDDIRIVAHVDEQARVLARYYGAQVFEGRASSLARELDLTKAKNWWKASVSAMPPIAPQSGQFEETQGLPFWLEYSSLIAFWESGFGKGSVTLRPYDADKFASPEIADEICACFDINGPLAPVDPVPLSAQPAAAWLERGRLLNDLILRVLAQGKRILPRPLWRGFIDEIEFGGPPIAPGSLAALSDRFAHSNAALEKAHPALSRGALTPETRLDSWVPADPGNGFRASQYLLSFMYRIDKATHAERKAKAVDLASLKDAPPPVAASASPKSPKKAPAPKNDPIAELTPIARKLMPARAIENFEALRTSSMAPHNRLGAVDEEQLAAAYSPLEPRKLTKGSSGNVIVGCMKNEAPYIVEWVAYHRAMGVDNFLIYTNDCTDGTTEILDRLQAMGVLEHRNNDKWKGNSPQQHALNQALKEPVIKNAEWIIHIDVDEFMNVRTGNGTLQDFFDAVPEATNVAMTWRLFGHNGVTRLADDLVIDQFDTCAPKFCPKPHTVWGFKTMFKNIGAYEKISCHRPNKLKEGKKKQVHWVNGSGKDMTREAAENGWRSSKKSIGYDLLQLNHYALRSAESFLIKRQRGRALHVDRSIGLNYWIRMDWSDFRDITIKRNIPRVRQEYDRLMQDDTLRTWHQSGMDWHQAKAIELHGMPEFEDLYQQALEVKLTETERVAYALALDMDS